LKSLPFKQDGVLEVASHKYLKWGYSNGLQKNEMQFLEKDEVQNLEPNIRCLAGIYCSKDGSIDYGVVTKELMEDARRFGCKLVTGSKVIRIVTRGHEHNDNNYGDDYGMGKDGIVLYTRFLINVLAETQSTQHKV